jgi:hypothetical protein
LIDLISVLSTMKISLGSFLCKQTHLAALDSLLVYNSADKLTCCSLCHHYQHSSPCWRQQASWPCAEAHQACCAGPATATA